MIFQDKRTGLFNNGLRSLPSRDLVRLTFERNRLNLSRPAPVGSVHIRDEGAARSPWSAAGGTGGFTNYQYMRPYRGFNSNSRGKEGNYVLVALYGPIYATTPYNSRNAISTGSAFLRVSMYLPAALTVGNTYYPLSVQDSTGTAAGTAWGFVISGRQLGFVYSNGTTRSVLYSGKDAMTAAGWYEFACDWSSNILSLYINRKVVAATYFAGPFNVPSGRSIRLGYPEASVSAFADNTAYDVVQIRRQGLFGGRDYHALPDRAFGAGSGFPSATGILDSYQTNIWGQWSCTRLLRSAYSGALIRVRRSSDNTEQDINASGQFLDVASLLSFVGAGSGYVTKIYDQGGNATRDFVQATTTKQARIVNSGVFDGKMVFDGTDDSYATGNTTGGNTGFTVALRANVRNTVSGTYMVLEHSPTVNSNKGEFVYASKAAGSSGQMNMCQSTDAVGTTNVVTGPVSTVVSEPENQVYRFDRTQSAALSAVVLFDKGVKQTSTTGSGAQTTTSTGTATPLYLGARNNASLFTQLDFYGMAAWEAALSDADCTAVSAIG